MMYSLSEAAKVAGKSRSTLSEAIRKGKLTAVKDDKGRYLIDPADLRRVYPPDGEPHGQPGADRSVDDTPAGATGDRPDAARPVDRSDGASTGQPAGLMDDRPVTDQSTNRLAEASVDGTGDVSSDADRSVDDAPAGATGDQPDAGRPIDQSNGASAGQPAGMPDDRSVTGQSTNRPTGVSPDGAGDVSPDANRSVDDALAGTTGQPAGLMDDRPVTGQSTNRLAEAPVDGTGDVSSDADRSVDDAPAGATGDQPGADRPVDRSNGASAGRPAGMTDDRPVTGQLTNRLTGALPDGAGHVSSDANRSVDGALAGATGDQSDVERPVDRSNGMLPAQIDQLDRLIAALESERAYSREMATRIGKLEAASHAPHPGPQVIYPMNGVQPPVPIPAGQDVEDLRSDIAAMRTEMREGQAGLGDALYRIQAALNTRPGFLNRVLFALPIAWCVMSGVYVAGVWVAFGPNEFWRIGQLSGWALFRTLWPF